MHIDNLQAQKKTSVDVFFVCLVEPGGFEPHFLLRIDLQSPALLDLLPRSACIVPRWSAVISTDYRHSSGQQCHIDINHLASAYSQFHTKGDSLWLIL